MCVYKRGAVYYMNFMMKGIRVNKSTGMDNRDDAIKVEEKEKKRMKLMLKRIDMKKLYRDSKRIKFSEAIDRAYDERWQYNRAGNHPLRMLTYCTQLLGDKYLDEIDENDISILKNHLRAKGRAEATINKYLASLRTLFNMGLNEWKILSVKPYFKIPRQKVCRLRIITDAEYNRILEILRTFKDYRRNNFTDAADVIEMLYHTGMRVGEVLSLTYTNNIDFDKRLIHIHPEKSKSGQPRSIPMTKRVKEILKKRRNAHPETPFPYSNFYIVDIFKKLRKKMGLENDKEFVAHSIRHTFASRLVQNDVEMYIIQRLLGHSDVRTTQRYAHLATNDLKNAMNKVFECADDEDDDVERLDVYGVCDADRILPEVEL